MVFSIASNEHTIKTLLNSRLATNNSTSYAPKFSLSTPIYSPLNMVSMVCLESCTILPLSMFTNTLMHDSVALFLYDFILKIRVFGISFEHVPGGADTPNTIFWETNPLKAGTNVGKIQAPSQLYNTGGLPWNTAEIHNGTNSSFTVAMLAYRLR